MEKKFQEYKLLRDEQARLETQRSNILVASFSITSLTALISQTSFSSTSLLYPFLINIFLIWSLSMYKSLTAQIIKTVLYIKLFMEEDNSVFVEKKWISDSLRFIDLKPAVPKAIKKWTHLFTLLSVISILLTLNAVLLKNDQIDSTFIFDKYPLICIVKVVLVIIQLSELIFLKYAVFDFDLYRDYEKTWKSIKQA